MGEGGVKRIYDRGRRFWRPEIHMIPFDVYDLHENEDRLRRFTRNFEHLMVSLRISSCTKSIEIYFQGSRKGSRGLNELYVQPPPPVKP